MQLEEEGQVAFKAKAKAFTRTYGFLSSILPHTDAGWEKLSIYLNFLVTKLPAPVEEDLSKGILEVIDMHSYRVEKRAAVRIQLPDADAEIDPVPSSGGGHIPEPEPDRLSNIPKSFNEQFGNVPWDDADRLHRVITEEIPGRVNADQAGLQQRPAELRQAERPHRARQGPDAGDDVGHEGPHRAVQAVHGQRRFQAVDVGYRVWVDVRIAGR